MVAMNSEDHRRGRRAEHRAFTPRRVAELGEVVQQVTDELLDRMSETARPDLIELAYPGPAARDHGDARPTARRRGASEGVGRRVGQIKRVCGAVTVDQVRLAHRSVEAFRGYVGEMVDRHRHPPPRSGLVAALLDAAGGDRLTEKELVANVVLFLFPGHETTTTCSAVESMRSCAIAPSGGGCAPSRSCCRRRSRSSCATTWGTR
jgi:cytochrome P450